MKKTISTDGLTGAQIDSAEAYVFAMKNGDVRGIEVEASIGWMPKRSFAFFINNKVRIAKPTAEDYLKGHRECGLKVGDQVRVTRVHSPEEAGFPVLPHSTYRHAMVGREYTIEKDHGEGGFELDGDYKWPHFCLEKIPPKYRPWTPEEALGKRIESKRTGIFYSIVSCSGAGWLRGGEETLFSTILRHYTQLDGSPCGVLEEGGAE